MAINRKGLRKITVDDQEFFWRFIVDGAHIFLEDPFGQISIDFGHIAMIEDLGDSDRGKNRPKFDSKSVTPKHILQAVQFAQETGWAAGKIDLQYRDGNYILKERIASEYDIPTALERLGFHSARDPRVDDPRWTNGFLGRLRPYKDMEHIEKNYHDVVACLRAVAPLCKDDMLPKNLANDMAGIVAYGRAWGCHPNGMVRRNDLITDKETEKLENIIDEIALIWSLLLDEQFDIAFESYDQGTFFNS